MKSCVFAEEFSTFGFQFLGLGGLSVSENGSGGSRGGRRPLVIAGMRSGGDRRGSSDADRGRGGGRPDRFGSRSRSWRWPPGQIREPIKVVAVAARTNLDTDRGHGGDRPDGSGADRGHGGGRRTGRGADRGHGGVRPDGSGSCREPGRGEVSVGFTVLGPGRGGVDRSGCRPRAGSSQRESRPLPFGTWVVAFGTCRVAAEGRVALIRSRSGCRFGPWRRRSRSKGGAAGAWRRRMAPQGDLRSRVGRRRGVYRRFLESVLGFRPQSGGSRTRREPILRRRAAFCYPWTAAPCTFGVPQLVRARKSGAVTK